MSRYVDQRVVEMDFDNKRFEKNVSQSMSTLDKLNEKLDFSNVSKQKIDTSPITSAIAKISNSFSAMEIAAITAISNITNRITNMAVEFTKSLTIDNVASGWSKYAQETTAVGTLMAQTIRMTTDELDENGKAIVKVVDEADKMSAITEQLEKLNWYTDETSYTFTDMVDNIGKFTAAGNSLNDSVDAMMGIANWAALSGQNAQTASRAMYQLSQAMSSGTVRLHDYGSIQTANMDTEEFRKTVLDTALELGTLQQSISGMYLVGNKKFTQGQFTKYLSEGWFTSDVLLKALKKYNAATDELYAAYSDPENEKTTSELIEELGDRLDKFGLKAFQAAQEARTFEDAIGSVKEGVASGWMNIFNTIFGNYEEAKTLWTDLANTLYDIIVEPLGDIIDLVKEWKQLGGRDDLFGRVDKDGNGVQGALWNMLETLQAIIDAAKEAWHAVFPAKTASDFKSLTENIREITASWMENTKWLENFKTTLTGIFSIFKVIRNFIRAIWKGLKPIRDFIKEVVLKIFDKITDFSKKISEAANGTEEFSGVIEKVSTVSERLVSIARRVYNIVSKALGYLFRATDAGESTYSIFSKVGDAIWNIIVRVLDFVDSILTMLETNEDVQNFFKAFGDFLRDLPGKIINAGTSIWNFITTNEDFKTVLEALWDICVNVWDFLKKLPGLIDNAVKAISGGKGVMELLAEGGKKVADVFHSVIGFFKGLFGVSDEENISEAIDKPIKQSINGVTAIVKEVAEGGKNVSKKIESKSSSSWRDTLLKFFNGFLSFLQGLLSVLEAVVSIIGTILQFVGDVLKSFGAELKLIFDGNLKATKTITKVLLVVGVIAAIIALIKNIVWNIGMMLPQTGINTVLDSISDFFYAKKWEIMANALMEFAKVLLIFVGVIIVLGNLPWQTLLKGGLLLVAGVGIIIGIVALCTKAFSKVNSTLTLADTTIGFSNKILGNFAARLDGLREALDFKLRIDSIAYLIRSFGVALTLMALSLSIIAKIPANEVWRAVLILGVMMAAIAGTVVILDKFYRGEGANAKGLKKTAVFSILAAASAISMLAKPLKKISEIAKNDPWALAEAAVVVLALLTTITLVNAQASKMSGGKGPGIASSVLAAAAAIMVLVIPLKALTKMAKEDPTELLVAAGVITALFMLLALSNGYSAKISKEYKPSNALSMLAAATSVAILIRPIEKIAELAKINSGALWQAVVIVGLLTSLLTIMTGFSTYMTKDVKPGNMVAMSIAMIAMATACAIIAGSVKMLTGLGLTVGELWAVGAIFLAAMAVIATALTVVSRVGMKNDDAGKKIRAIAAAYVGISAAMVILAAGLKILSTIDQTALITGAIIFAGVVTLLTGLSIAIEKLNASNAILILAGSIGILAASALLFATALKILSSIGPEGAENLKTLLAKILSIVPAIGEAIALAFVTIIQTLIGMLGVIVTGLLESIAKVLATVAPLLGPIFDSILSILNENKDFIVGILTTLLNILLETIINIAPQLAEAVVTLLVALLNALKEHAPEIIEFVKGVLTDLLELLVWLVQELPTYASDIFKGLWELFVAIWDETIGHIPELVNMVFKAIRDFLDTMAANFGPTGQSIVNFVLTFIKTVIDSGVKIIVGSVNIFIQGVIDLFNGIADGIEQNTEPLVKAFDRVWSAIWNAFKAFFGIHSPSKKFKEAGGDMMDGLKEGVNDSGGTGGSKFWNGVKSVFSGIWSSIQGAFSGAFQEGKNILNNIKSGMESAGNWLKETGSNIVEGLGNGIQTAASTVKNAAENVASWFTTTFNNVLGINSPSRYMKQEGIFMAEGLAEGIEEGSDTVEDSAEDMSSGLTGIFGKLGTKLASVFGLDDVASPFAALFGDSGLELDTSSLLGGLDSDDLNLTDQLQNVLGATQDLEDSDLEIDVGVNFIPDLSQYDAAIDDLKAPTIEDINSGTYANAAATSETVAAKKASTETASSSSSTTETASATASGDGISNTFYITGNNPKEIADEVSKIIQKQIDRRKAVWAT